MKGKPFFRSFLYLVMVFALASCTPAGASPTTAPIPGGEAITQVKIYLIDLEAASGQAGAIGCGDRLVAIPVQIEPATGTEAALQAAYERLFTEGSRIAQEQGLYNALDQSGLQVDRIKIEDHTASIELAGELILGGVCDNPRVEAQLEQTALQFEQVENGWIFVNGTPLEEALSLK